jgi:hypothetical protein
MPAAFEIRHLSLVIALADNRELIASFRPITKVRRKDERTDEYLRTFVIGRYAPLVLARGIASLPGRLCNHTPECQTKQCKKRKSGTLQPAARPTRLYRTLAAPIGPFWHPWIPPPCCLVVPARRDSGSDLPLPALSRAPRVGLAERGGFPRWRFGLGSAGLGSGTRIWAAQSTKRIPISNVSARIRRQCATVPTMRVGSPVRFGRKASTRVPVRRR